MFEKKFEKNSSAQDQDDIDDMNKQTASVIRGAIQGHFRNLYKKTGEGTQRIPPPRRQPPPPRRRNQSITESLIRRLIKKSISDNLK